MRTTRISRRINAPRAKVYRALVDAEAIAAWKVPTGMRSHVHAFDAREGGAFRVSLTYDQPTGTGKTSAHTDTYRGCFVKLVPDEQVVEALEFETADQNLRGEMKDHDHARRRARRHRAAGAARGPAVGGGAR